MTKLVGSATAGAAGVSPLRQKYDEFVTYLKVSIQSKSGPFRETDFISCQTLPAGDLPEAYVKLRQTIKNVRRYYYAQTIALVFQCKDLADHFNTHKSAINFEPLST